MAKSMKGAGAEWQRYYMLPIVGALGYATSVIHIYGMSPYYKPLAEAFGWSRTQISFGLTLSTIIQAVFGILIGLAVDRFGPRRFALLGIPATCAAFALLSTVNGSEGQWYLLWVVLAIATLPIQATVWTAAVATRFEKSRGLAFAVTLCGASVAISLFPLMATWLIEQYGWRTALIAQGAVWGVIAYIPIFLFFRGARDKQRTDTPAGEEKHVELAGSTLLEGIRSTVYMRLLLASLLFTFTIVALAVHFVPILTDGGATPLQAAGVNVLIGIFSIVGRLTTGLLLDKLRGSMVGAAIFLLPAPACIALLLGGDHVAAQAFAAIMIGLTLGAEIDVVVYLTTRYFGLKNFGGLYGGLLAALSIGTAFGPTSASKVFDLYGGYAPFLWFTIGCMLLSSVALASLPRPHPEAQGEPEPLPA